MVLEYAFDCAPLSGSKSGLLLENPDRGLRMENYLTPYDCTGFPATQRHLNAFELLKNNLTKYADERPQLTQLYIYLSQYYDRDLDARAIGCMQKYFRYLREKRLKALVLFAYTYDEASPNDPSTRQILRHIDQLQPLLEQFRDCIHAVQAGFIGLWGEWHHEGQPHDRKAILEAILDARPPNVFVQIRMADYKNLLDPDDERRRWIGYMDMYLVGADHRWSISLFPGMPQHEQILRECGELLMDGEMPWGADTSEVSTVDGMQMARRLQQQHFTTLSLEHNYREAGYFSDFAMRKWQRQRLTPRILQEQGLRWAPGWFQNAFGKTTSRSLFEYIQDHLGYVVGLVEGRAVVEGDCLRASGVLMNYGFAAPLAMERLELVLFGPSKRPLEARPLCAVTDLQPGRAVAFETVFPGAAAAVKGGAGLGVRFVNSAGTSARLCNELPFEAGLNVLCSFYSVPDCQERRPA